MQTDAAGNPAGHWRPTPWDKDSEDWKKIDAQLEPEHMARKIDAMVAMLNLSQLAAGYAGVGRVRSART
ncbi:MAG: hypothetical protein NTY19_36670 [Planctomycetota bacterium]|nr:hypothetical protein [Planctomycetota bacterium]